VEVRWEWLQSGLTAPYVPTLGPTHPLAITTGLFADVLQVAGTGRFLPHDKDRRWSARKNEQVLAGAIAQEPGLALVPTLSTGRSPCVKIHIYSRDPHGALARAAELGRRLCDERGVGKGRLIWFLPPGTDPDPVAACTRIQMRTFGPGQQIPATEPDAARVTPLDEVCGPVRATFSAFAEKLAAEGFAFLDGQIRESATGPVLTCRRDEKIVGAIGPMETMPDSQGVARLLPQYFGILPEHRGLGLGRALWRAAMNWGQQHQAAYQLLQTEVGGASDRLCLSEGLTDLGLVCASIL
jgi:GNAT superfamily N-acetyltransferase